MFRAKISRLWPIAAVVLLFVISVIIRLPSFGLDPAKDWGSTYFERSNNLEVWDHDKFVLNVYANHPASVHKFAAYIGGGEEFLLNKDDPALTVYTSFPPTHFIALYAALTVIGGHYTYFAMQLFSLALHALCVGLMGYLVYLLTRDKLLAVLGASIYIFSTGTLWNHMNVYWAHQLLMPVFLAALIVFVKRKGLLKWWQSLSFGFAMSLITWTGAVASVGFTLYGLYKFRKTKNRAYLSYLFMVAGMLLALSLIFLQVFLATGVSVHEYLGKVFHRAQARSITTHNWSFPLMVWRFLCCLVQDYGGYMLIAYTLALRRKLKGFEWDVLFVASFPIIESLVLLEHDWIYGFGRLKWIVPIILAICLLGKRFATTKKRRILLAATIALANLVHIALYFVVYQAVK